MATLRVLAIAVATAVLVWASAPALAGPPGGRGHGGGPPTDRGHRAATKGDVKGDREAKSDQDAKRVQENEQNVKADQDKEADVKDEKKDGQNKTTGEKKQLDKTHAKKPSNKGGKKRGLDRADEVAGEHGRQGRETAREHAAKQAGGLGR